jgi:hypothetical protein
VAWWGLKSPYSLGALRLSAFLYLVKRDFTIEIYNKPLYWRLKEMNIL